MKKVSDNFRNALRGIRQVDSILSYASDESYYVLTTEGSNDIITENNELLATQKGPVIYKAESINNISYNCNVNLLKTICKYIQVDCQYSIPKKTSLNLKIGVKVGSSYEYLDYGNYLIIDEPEYKLDTKSYVITAYDKMVESMVNYDDNPLNINYPITVKNYLIEICKHFKWNYNLENIVNGDKIIAKELFLGQNLTYRDILDNISQVIAANLMFDNDTLIAKYIDEYTENDFELTDEDLRDTNVSISEKYGPVNALLITTNKNVVLNNLVDETSISENGKTEFQIDDNYILNYNSENFIQGIFNVVKNTEYYLYDLDNIGSLIFDPLDNFKVNYEGKKYNTIMLNDNIRLTTGLIENLFADKPNIDVSEYIANNKMEKDINNALISIDKANSQIVLKATSDGKIAQIRLDGASDEGTIIEINADQLNLSANDILNILSNNTINLTSKNIIIDSTNFKVDEKGNATMNNVIVNGGILKISDDSTESQLKSNITIYNKNDSSQEMKVSSLGINASKNNSKAQYNINKFSLNYNNSYDNRGFITGNVKDGYARLQLWGNDGYRYVTIVANDEENTYIKVENASTFSSMTPNGVWSPSFNNNSIEEVKKNIEKLKSSAIKLINDTDLYNYNYKSESDKDKKHIGIVIGDNYNYAKEILSSDGKGVDLYSMISVAWQAIKEQQEQIETMQKSYSFFIDKINKLESKLKILGGKNE